VHEERHSTVCLSVDTLCVRRPGRITWDDRHRHHVSGAGTIFPGYGARWASKSVVVRGGLGCGLSRRIRGLLCSGHHLASLLLHTSCRREEYLACCTSTLYRLVLAWHRYGVA